MSTGERIEFNRKPTKCPKCNSKRIAKIIYGMPYYSPETEKLIQEGKIVLGGCIVTDDDPVWECADCGAGFWKRKVC